MNARQVLVSSNELELIQRDIINDFLKVEDSLPKDCRYSYSKNKHGSWLYEDFSAQKSK